MIIMYVKTCLGVMSSLTQCPTLEAPYASMRQLAGVIRISLYTP